MRKANVFAASVALMSLSGCVSFKPPYWSGSYAVPNPGQPTTTTRFLSLRDNTDIEY